MWKIFLLSLLSFIDTGLIKSNSIFDYSHSKNEPLNILAGSLSSLRAIIPFEYTKLQICKPQKYEKAEDTLGEILTGESFYTTGYLANTNEDNFCQILCYNSFTYSKVNESFHCSIYCWSNVHCCFSYWTILGYIS